MPIFIAVAASLGIAWKAISKGVAIGAQVTASLALLVAHGAALFAMYKIISFFYEQYNALQTYIANAQGIDGIDTFFMILQSTGILPAFIDVFTIFQPLFISFFLYYGARMLYLSLLETSNQVFKIGVLAQQ